MNALVNPFGPDNLPFCLLGELPSHGIRLREFLVDLVALAPATPRRLTKLFAAGRAAALALWERVGKRIEFGQELPLLPVEAQPLHLTFSIPNYVAFYSSLPVAYHGRASHVVPGGCAVVQPRGQYKTAQMEFVFAATEQLDFELDKGVFLCAGAEDRLVPPGPFFSKGFATPVSPYPSVPEALQEPRPLPHLQVSEPSNFDTALEASVIPAGLSRETFMTQTNYRHISWSHQQRGQAVKAACLSARSRFCKTAIQ